jgi:hypothetical protein
MSKEKLTVGLTPKAEIVSGFDGYDDDYIVNNKKAAANSSASDDQHTGNDDISSDDDIGVVIDNPDEDDYEYDSDGVLISKGRVSSECDKFLALLSCHRYAITEQD